MQYNGTDFIPDCSGMVLIMDNTWNFEKFCFYTEMPSQQLELYQYFGHTESHFLVISHIWFSMHARQHQHLHKDFSLKVSQCSSHIQNSHSWNPTIKSIKWVNWTKEDKLHNAHPPEYVAVDSCSQAQVKATHLPQINSISMGEQNSVAGIRCTSDWQE